MAGTSIRYELKDTVRYGRSVGLSRAEASRTTARPW
jgi:hypothetical protein